MAMLAILFRQSREHVVSERASASKDEIDGKEWEYIGAKPAAGATEE